MGNARVRGCFLASFVYRCSRSGRVRAAGGCGVDEALGLSWRPYIALLAELGVVLKWSRDTRSSSESQPASDGETALRAMYEKRIAMAGLCTLQRQLDVVLLLKAGVDKALEERGITAAQLTTQNSSVAAAQLLQDDKRRVLKSQAEIAWSCIFNTCAKPRDVKRWRRVR